MKYSTKQELIRHLVEGWSREGIKTTCLRHTLRGDVLWAVWERTFPLRSPDRWISCEVLTNSDKGLIYKSMEEWDYPKHYTCPLAYLDMVPEAVRQDWRDQVIVYHQKIKDRRNKIRKKKGLKLLEVFTGVLRVQIQL